MLYFSYGSNMSVRRLLDRVISAERITVAQLRGHNLQFHKIGRLDGSGKCDVCYSGDHKHSVFGVLFRISRSAKIALDCIEGLGGGYQEKSVCVTTHDGINMDAVTYYATCIDPTLKPFHWYKTHVVTGAKENRLPVEYISLIESVDSIPDPDPERENRELCIYQP